MHLPPFVVVQHEVVVQLALPQVVALNALCTKWAVESDFGPLLKTCSVEVMIAVCPIVAVNIQTDAALH